MSEKNVLDAGKLAELGAGKVLKAISRHCVAVRVSVHGIGKERQLDGAIVSVDDQAVASDLCFARARLTPRELSSRLDGIAARARKIPSSRGVSFPGGAYLVPIGANVESGPAAIVFQQIKEVREEYHEAALELQPLWEANAERLKGELFYEQVKGFLVDGPTFVAKHTIDLQLLPLGGAPPDMYDRIYRRLCEEGLSPEKVSAIAHDFCEMVDSAAIAGIGSENQTIGWVREVQQMTSVAATRAVQNMIAEPIAEFIESVRALETGLTNNRGIQSASIEKARRAFNKLQSFDFMMPADIRAKAAALGDQLNRTDARDVSGRGGADVASRLAAAIRGIREELLQPSAQLDMLQEFSRSIDL